MTPNSAPHVIRLRGPWQYEPLKRLALAADGVCTLPESELPPPGEIVMPDDWGRTLGSDFRGRVRYVRLFGRPTNLEPDEVVWLACDGVDLRGWAWLNGEPLGTIDGYRAAWRYDVTRLLTERNRLIVEVELPPLDYQTEQRERPDRASLAGGIIGEVRLEIESGPPA